MNTKLKKILLAVDGSEQSFEAARYAGRFLPGRSFQVVVYHVMSDVPEFYYDLAEESPFRQTILKMRGWEIALKDSINDFMSGIRRTLIKDGVPEGYIIFDIHERHSGIARDIIGESSKAYDAVIMGRSGINELDHILLGSVANKVFTALRDVPVCLVGSNPKPGKILLALDESDGAMLAADYVKAMFDPGHTEVTLFHAVRDFDIYERKQGINLGTDTNRDWLKSYKVGTLFEKVKTQLREAGFDYQGVTGKIVKGVYSRAGAIVAEARSGGYGTIVVGRRGISRVKAFPAGSVCSKVVQLAKEQAVWVVG